MKNLSSYRVHKKMLTPTTDANADADNEDVELQLQSWP